MRYRIAIHPDRVRQKDGRLQSFSERWAELAPDHGVEVHFVDARAPDFFAQLSGCAGFMWRFGFTPRSLVFAKRLLPAVEHGLGIPTFPSQATAWHFEDKIAQTYLLQAAGFAIPETRIFWDPGAAARFCRDARYPLVLKLSTGFQSANVRLLRDVDEAIGWIRMLFGTGLPSLEPPGRLLDKILRHRLQALRLLAGNPLPPGIQHGYFYVQEYLADNEFDTRVTVIGDRAFAFRRFNRPGDFRASGSGLIDWEPEPIDLETVRLAFRIARRLDTQSVAIDGMRRGAERVVGEISYTYAAWAVHECPGHWLLRGAPDVGRLEWVEGRLRAEDAIFADFVSALEASSPRPCAAG